MAGYIFTFSTPESLFECVELGAYSTKFGSEPNGYWQAFHEGTVADYVSMREGDNVYFFSKRLIYGIGSLVNVGPDCKYLNFPDSNLPQPFPYSDIQSSLLVDFGPQSPTNRFICFFQPSPYIFRQGVDMDDVLSSDPDRFKMLRVFSRLSFIKFDDQENQAFKDILLKRNSNHLAAPSQTATFATKHTQTHNQVLQRISGNNYSLDVGPVLKAAAQSNGSISHEMAIEAGVISEIASSSPTAKPIFGEWDYISHQVAASPLKPVQYIDKMDLFGYAYIPGHRPTIERFFVGEIKASLVTKQDLLQLMKYVDWVRDEYASGDYSMIRAFLIGHDFDADVKPAIAEYAERNYVRGIRDTVSNETWNDVILVKYLFNSNTSSLSFSIV